MLTRMQGGCLDRRLVGVSLLVAACGGRNTLDSGFELEPQGGRTSGGAATSGGQPTNGGASQGGAAPHGGAGPRGGTYNYGGSFTYGGAFIHGGGPAGGAPWTSGGSSGAGGRWTFGGGGTFGGGAGGWLPGGGPSTGGAFNCAQCPPSDQCNRNYCDVQNRRCVVQPVPEGSFCDDGDFCTIGEACFAGACRGGKPNTCGLGAGTCETVLCSSARKACTITLQADGSSCSTGEACSVNGRCLSGRCLGSTRDCSGTPLPNECFAAVCDASSGQCKAVPTSGGTCGEKNLCTGPSICQNGTCVAPPVQVDCSGLDSDCMVGVCDPNSGACVAYPVANGQACEDGSACTLRDSCTNGTCQSGKLITMCLDNDGCCPAGCSGSDSDCSNIINFDATFRGWRQSNGSHSSTNLNTYTGWLQPSTYDSFFVFDFSTLSRTVVSATLELELESYFGPDAAETASVWDVTTPIATMIGNNTDVAAFKDLESGVNYSTFTATRAQVGSVLQIPLATAAVSDINAARGKQFAVGVHIESLSAKGGDEALRFSQSSEPRTHRLVLTTK